MTPMMVGLLVTGIASGLLISRYGRYRPFPIVGTALATGALYLLSRLEVATPTGSAAVYLLILGLGLGLTMQVLVLAAQNAVDYRLLGVATSGSSLARQIGGSIGVSIFGAIFANRLGRQLAQNLPHGVHAPANGSPAVVHHPPARHSCGVCRGVCGRPSPGLPHRCRSHARRLRPELAASRRAPARGGRVPRAPARASRRGLRVPQASSRGSPA
jgi:hypothetical protein